MGRSVAVSPSASLIALTALAALAPSGCARGAEAPAPAATPAPSEARSGPVTVDIVAFNDFHGHLEPPVEPWGTGADAVRAGGAAYLAAHLARVRAESPEAIVVSAGDLVGASPLTSALLHDEPTIEVMNAMGIDLNAVGNHEFDEGADELVRLIGGGCHPTDGCQGTSPWEGAKFATLAANVKRSAAQETLFPPFLVRTVGPVKIAFIGLGLASTATHQPPGFGGVGFAGEAQTANALVPALRGSGVEAIVVVVHEGLVTKGGMNACVEPTGDLVKLVERLDPAIDLVISGHTHHAYVCKLGGRVATSAGSYGRLYTRIALTIDPRTRDVEAVSAENHLVTHDLPPDPAVGAIVDRWVERARAQGDRVVGHITADLRRTPSPGGDSPLGRLIADAQLAATKGDGAVAALMHARGIRSELSFARGDREPTDGIVTFAEVAAVHPFENRLVTLDLTGADLLAFLDSSYAGPEDPRHFMPSRGLSWTWSAAAHRVDPQSLRIDGKVVDRAGTYRITVNDYLAGRGVLARGTNEKRSVSDRDALVAYLETHPSVAPPTPARVTRR